MKGVPPLFPLPPPPLLTALCSVGVDRTRMMDCTSGPLECMHVNKWVQCAHVSPYPTLPFLSACLLPFFPKALLATLICPSLSVTSAVLDIYAQIYVHIHK